jgi:hypothetical protein
MVHDAAAAAADGSCTAQAAATLLGGINVRQLAQAVETTLATMPPPASASASAGASADIDQAMAEQLQAETETAIASTVCAQGKAGGGRGAPRLRGSRSSLRTRVTGITGRSPRPNLAPLLNLNRNRGNNGNGSNNGSGSNNGNGNSNSNSNGSSRNSNGSSRNSNSNGSSRNSNSNSNSNNGNRGNNGLRRLERLIRVLVLLLMFRVQPNLEHSYLRGYKAPVTGLVVAPAKTMVSYEHPQSRFLLPDWNAEAKALAPFQRRANVGQSMAEAPVGQWQVQAPTVPLECDSTLGHCHEKQPKGNVRMARTRGGKRMRTSKRTLRGRGGGQSQDAAIRAAVQLAAAWPQLADAVSAQMGVPLGKDMATGIRVAASLAATAAAAE